MTRRGELPPGGPGVEPYLLRLYVSGSTPRSIRAIENMKRICETHLRGRYQLEVIDIYQHPEDARRHQVVAAPTLIKLLPEPLRRFIGDLSDNERVLQGLDLLPLALGKDYPGEHDGAA